MTRLIALMTLAAVGLTAAALAVGGSTAAGVSGAAALGTAAIVGILILVALGLLLYWFIFRVHRLDLALIGLSGATHVPAVPFNLSQLPGTALKLLERAKQFEQAVNALSTDWIIRTPSHDYNANAYTFMGMEYASAAARAADPRTRLSLSSPDQFSMSWTTYGGVHERAAREWLPKFSASLDDATAATEQFWPTIARFGLALNLIILRRVTDEAQFKALLGPDWTPPMRAWLTGTLYVIDMRLFAQFAPDVVNGATRFTPGTLTFLERDPVTRRIVPFAVRVSDAGGQTVQYLRGDPAWLYALQAAKTSITVWGIWLGHVYHWHLVTAAMQMTMFQTLDAQHPVMQLFGRQSDSLIGFDEFLLLDWSIAPPTSVTTSVQFLQLCDAFAKGRKFFDDDPRETHLALGLRAEDFTNAQPWDQYPVVGYLLTLYDATARYVATAVDAFYPDDASVAADAGLQSWIAASGKARRGNVRGLPAMSGNGAKAALTRVLTSLIYRVTAHGASRLNQVANPALTFTANFPPCLQDATLPAPGTPIKFAGVDAPPGTLALAGVLPNTGTIGEMSTFLFTFIYSPPYTPFIPLQGIGEDALFVGPSGVPEICKDALIQYRRDLLAFIDLWAKDEGVPGVPAQMHQWELSIEE
jgi:hypothetical protein